MEAANNRRFEQSLMVPLGTVAILWVIHLMQIILNYDFAWMGIYPRQLFGVKGIFLAPFIHGSFSHLMSNSIPTLFVGTMIYYFYRTVATRSIFMIYLLTGFAVWLFARSVFHIGISGVGYRMISFVSFMGIFRTNVRSIVLALIIVVLYSGSYFSGVLPNQIGISWESHLCGALVGIFTAYFYKGEIEEEEQEENPFAHEPARENRPYFLPRDTFEKTKAERIREEAERRAAEEARRNNPDWYSNNTLDDGDAW